MAEASGLKLVTLIPGCGYGDAACRYGAGLEQAGLQVSWLPTRDDSADILPLEVASSDLPEDIRAPLSAQYQRDVDAQAILLDVPPFRWHYHWLKAESRLRAYCYLAWEADRLPNQWPEALNGYEKIFVPSQFNKVVFEEGGVTAPVAVIGHAARPINPTGPTLDLGAVADGDFLFYTVGAWTARKDMEATICAYLDAFTGDEPVALIVKTEVFDQVALAQASPAQRSGREAMRLSTAFSLAAIISRYSNPAKIHLISGRVSPGQIDQLHCRGDCYISLTHSEGWGLGALDAALAGNPVVITGWGGQLEYLGESYPHLVDYTLEPTLNYPDDGFYYRAADVHWAQPDRAQGSAHMRALFLQRGRSNEHEVELSQALQQRYSSAILCRDMAAQMGFEL